MSSQEEDHRLDRAGRIKRRGRACDLCRHKKVRCDGQPGERCSNCTTANQECTYLNEAKKRYPDAERIKELETEVANYKKLLNKLHPGVDFSRELSGILNDNSLWMLDGAVPGKPGSGSGKQNPLRFPTPPTTVPQVDDDDIESSDDEAHSQLELQRSMQALTLNSEFPRYLGKSSRLRFFKQAYDLKQSYAGVEPGTTMINERLRLSLTRAKYIRSQPWILPSFDPPPVPNYTYPEEDVLQALIELYFTNFNVFLPLLHRPTFDACVAAGLHMEDEGFASLLLMVCACGAKLSTDPRVKSEGTDNWHSAGWKYFSQVQAVRRAINLRLPRLYDIQIPCLIHCYLHGSCVSHPAWAAVGLGLRLAQDMGAHRRKSYDNKPSVEGELMKRAFWMLVTLDRALCFALGRPCSIEDEDMDVDFPAECDDEYWLTADPAQAFKQPEGKPSTVSFFIAQLRLKQIHAFALRTIYSTKKSKVLQGHRGPEWEEHAVSELDSALNKWIDSVPDHLRWDPHQENEVFFKQSAFLYSSYYGTQINVHRPFIPSPRKPSRLSFPSLAICTNAARSCIHVLHVQYRRLGIMPFLNVAGLFSSAIVLLLNIWGGKRAGVSINPAKEMEEVHKAMEMLTALESRWYSAGRFLEVLRDLANFGELPLPEPAVRGQKRSRGADDAVTPAPSAPSDPPVTNGQRHIAGTKRASLSMYHGEVTPEYSPSMADAPVFSPSMDFVLPVHSDELGRLPIFPAQPGQIAPAVPTNVWSEFDMSPSVFGSPSPDGTSGSSGLGTMPSPAGVAPPYVDTFGAVPPASMGTGQYPIPTFSAFQNMAPAMPSSGVGAHDPANGLPTTSVEFQMPHVGQHDVVGGTSNGGMLAMWSSAPEGFEWDEWGLYISNMNVPSTGV